MTIDEVAAPAVRTRPRRPRLVTAEFVLLLGSALGFFLALGATLPVLPLFVSQHLGGGDVAVGVAVGVVAASALGIRPVGTPRIATWGHQRILLVSLLAGALSLAAHGLTTTLWQLIALRLVTGAATAMVFVAALTRVMATVPADRRGTAVSYFSVAPYLGMGFGPVVGRPCYEALGPVGAFAVAGGIALLGVPLLLFVPNIRTAPAAGPAGPRISRAALAPGTVLGLGILGMIGMSAFLALYVAELDPGASPEWIFLTYAGVVLVARVLGGPLTDRIGGLRTGTFSSVFIVAGLAGFTVAPAVSWLYGSAVVFGIGMALQYPGLLALTVNRVPARERDAAVSTFTMFFDLAAGVGGLLLGAVAAVGGYRSAFGACAACSLAGLVVLWTLVRAGEPAGPDRVQVAGGPAAPPLPATGRADR